jgi:hypothetical protein
VRLDIPRGHPPAVERQDLLVKPLKPPLTLFDQLRCKAPVAIARGVNNGINEFIFVLRRGNYIIPQRRDRSFPLITREESRDFKPPH